MFKQLKQKRLQKQYKKAQNIYIVVLWAKWAVLPAKFSGKFNKYNDPLTIQFTDHNGAEDLYYIDVWHFESSGATIAYFFNEADARRLANLLNENKVY